MKNAKLPADISRWNQGLRPVRAIDSAGAWSRQGSDLALGVGNALDQIVTALVGRDLTGEAFLDLDVELIGPGKCHG